MPLKVLLLVMEQPQAGPSKSDVTQRKGTSGELGLLSPHHQAGPSRPSSFRSSISQAQTQDHRNHQHRPNQYTTPSRSSILSFTTSEADPDYHASPRSPAASTMRTTSGTDYAATTPPLSPPLLLPPSIPKASAFQSRRMPPEPEPPPQLDDRGRPILHLKTRFPLVGSALMYYHGLEEIEEEEQDASGSTLPEPSTQESDEARDGTKSKLKNDWKTNPKVKIRGKIHREEDEHNVLHAPMRWTPPVRFGREEDEFGQWLNEDRFWAGKHINKNQFGWRKRTPIEMAEILAAAEQKLEAKKAPSVPIDSAPIPEKPIHELTEVPTVTMTEITASSHHGPTTCMQVGAWQFAIPLPQMTFDQLKGLRQAGILSVALPVGHPVSRFTVGDLIIGEMITPTTRSNRTSVASSVRSFRDSLMPERSQVLSVPSLSVIPASPSTPTPAAAQAAPSDQKDGFGSFFSRAQKAREQLLRPSSSSSLASIPGSPTSPSSPMSSMIDTPPSPTLSTPSVNSARQSMDNASVLSQESTSSRKWMNWATSKWGR